MTDLLVLCPSFGRPREARAVMDSFLRTRRADSILAFLVWSQDDSWSRYPPHATFLIPEERMGPRTNASLEQLRARYEPRHVGWIADDNRLETIGWDRAVIDALDGGARVCFGNDVVSPGSKPSHVFMDARIPEALGWLVHPKMRSTFFDDVWEQIGRGLGFGKLRYLPNVRIPHLYVEKDNHHDYAHDMAVFQRWVREEMDDDVARARRALRQAGVGRPAIPEGRMGDRSRPRTAPQAANGREAAGVSARA